MSKYRSHGRGGPMSTFTQPHPLSPIATVEERFYYYTQKAGDVCRQLGIVGVVIVWVFHSTVSQAVSATLPLRFRWPVILIVISLAIDAIQYIWGSIVWGWKWFAGAGME